MSIPHLEQLIFDFATELTGRYRSPNDLTGAIEDISTFPFPSATLGEITTTGIIFINVMPFFLAGLIYLMNQKLSHIIPNPKTGETWVFKDALNLFDLIVTFGAAIFPVLSVFIIYSVTLAVNNTGIEFGCFGWCNLKLYPLSPAEASKWDEKSITFFREILTLVLIPTAIYTFRLVRKSLGLVLLYQADTKLGLRLKWIPKNLKTWLLKSI